MTKKEIERYCSGQGSCDTCCIKNECQEDFIKNPTSIQPCSTHCNRCPLREGCQDAPPTLGGGFGKSVSAKKIQEFPCRFDGISVTEYTDGIWLECCFDSKFDRLQVPTIPNYDEVATYAATAHGCGTLNTLNGFFSRRGGENV